MSPDGPKTADECPLFRCYRGESGRNADIAFRKRLTPERTYIGCVRRCRIASFSRKTVEHSFFREPGLAQAIDNNRQSRYRLHKKFDRELRIGTTRLRQSEFRLGVVPLRGLSTRQKGVGIIGRVSQYDGMLKLLDSRVKPTLAELGKTQVDVPDAAEGIAGA
jgi:hypothetical protein